jgi:hypothetical protein
VTKKALMRISSNIESNRDRISVPVKAGKLFISATWVDGRQKLQTKAKEIILFFGMMALLLSKEK